MPATPVTNYHCGYSDPCSGDDVCVDERSTHEDLDPGEPCHIRNCDFVAPEAQS